MTDRVMDRPVDAGDFLIPILQYVVRHVEAGEMMSEDQFDEEFDDILEEITRDISPPGDVTIIAVPLCAMFAAVMFTRNKKARKKNFHDVILTLRMTLITQMVAYARVNEVVDEVSNLVSAIQRSNRGRK